MHVCIYSDQGVGPFSLRQIVARVRERESKYELLSKEKLLEGSWVERADIFVMPGGQDVPYDRALSGKGTELISSYVHQGGHYLGICAGAYFACSEIEFDQGTEMEVMETRDLKFFKGSAIGPAFGIGSYSYESESGAKAISLEWNDNTSFYSYFNGGCFFREASSFKEIEVFARYSELEGNPAAIIRSKVGQGIATLSGVHIEYSPLALSKDDPYLKDVIPVLTRDRERNIQALDILLSTGV